jgi:hypothetical protein
MLMRDRVLGDVRPACDEAWDATMPDQPAFLVGSVRSGTTLLRLMLDHHPAIAFFSEFEFVVNPLPPDEGFITIDQFRDYAQYERMFRSSGFQVRDGVKTFPEMARDFLEQLRQRTGKRVVGATVHENFDRVLRIWPAAKFIHIARDPRDVARSVVDMGWAGNPWAGARRWIEAESLWDRIRPTIPADRQIEVRYEGLVADPVGALTRLARFMGLAYDPAMMSYPNDSTYGPPATALVNQWKRKMSDRDVQLVEARVGDLLAARGYPPSGLPPLRVTPQMEKRLRREDKSGRRRFRMNRYGWGWWTADAVTRWLHFGPLYRRVRRKLDEIDSRYLK